MGLPVLFRVSRPLTQHTPCHRTVFRRCGTNDHIVRLKISKERKFFFPRLAVLKREHIFSPHARVVVGTARPIEQHPALPNHANVQFVQVLSRNAVARTDLGTRRRPHARVRLELARDRRGVPRQGTRRRSCDRSHGGRRPQHRCRQRFEPGDDRSGRRDLQRLLQRRPASAADELTFASHCPMRRG